MYCQFTLEQLKLDPQTHIYLESVSPEEHLKYEQRPYVPSFTHGVLYVDASYIGSAGQLWEYCLL